MKLENAEKIQVDPPAKERRKYTIEDSVKISFTKMDNL